MSASLESFIAGIEKKLDDLLTELQLSPTDFLANEEKAKGMVSCPIDASHIVSASNLDSHKFTCSLRKLGVDPQKIVVLPSPAFYYKELPGVVNLPHAEKEPEPSNTTPAPAVPAPFALAPPGLMVPPGVLPVPKPPLIAPGVVAPGLTPPGLGLPLAPLGVSRPPAPLPTAPVKPPPTPGMITAVRTLQEISDLEVEDESAAQAEDLAWYKRPLLADHVVNLDDYAPLKAKRVVRRWRTIPSNFQKLDFKAVDAKRAKGFLIQNMDKYSKVIEEIEDFNYIYTTIVETNNPDAIVGKLYDAVGKKTRQLVRHFWKWTILALHEQNYKKLSEEGKAPAEPAGEEHDEDIGLDDIDDDAERAELNRKIKEPLRPPSCSPCSSPSLPHHH